jgi:hypothetical protein
VDPEDGAEIDTGQETPQRSRLDEGKPHEECGEVVHHVGSHDTRGQCAHRSPRTLTAQHLTERQVIDGRRREQRQAAGDGYRVDGERSPWDVPGDGDHDQGADRCNCPGRETDGCTGREPDDEEEDDGDSDT